MPKLSYALIACLLMVFALPAVAQASSSNGDVAPAETIRPDSSQIEKDLQQLPWRQFRAIIESVPKLKADVDAFGPLGWQYVQANYTTYGWKKNIDKLDDAQKNRLAELIQTAKGSR